MKITFLGTTMLLFDDGKDQILFDCHVTRPSLLRCGFGRFETDKKIADKIIKENDINRLKGIFVSHSHHDHVMDAPYFANVTDARIYGSKSVLNVARGGNVAEEHLTEFKHLDQFGVGEYKVTVMKSIHSKAHWYNNDLGQIIEKPLVQPARKKDYKEGGSFDFLVEHTGTKYLIRPSYNYIEGQLDGIDADVLLLGITGLSKDSELNKKRFFEETIDKVNPEVVIPVHWDDFFRAFDKGVKRLNPAMGDGEGSLREVEGYCRSKGVEFKLLEPFESCII